jgi:coenzyme F420-reducing hydrogenase alpha subunit
MIWKAEMEERISGLGQELDTIKKAREGMNFMNLQSDIYERVSEVRREFADELARTRKEMTWESRRESDERRSSELADEKTSPDQVQDTLKDLLILWSSLKELEVKKVDKTVFTDEIGILESQIATIKVCFF